MMLWCPGGELVCCIWYRSQRDDRMEKTVSSLFVEILRERQDVLATPSCERGALASDMLDLC